MRADDQIVKVRYYTAIIKGEPDAAHRQKVYLEALAAHRPGAVEIVRGYFKPKRFRCRYCGARWKCECKPPLEYRTYEEKLTDVALGTAMVRDAAEGIGDTSILVSADTDFQPAIEACLEVDPARQIFVACPPGRHNPRNTFDGRVTSFRISEEHFAAAQLPERVTHRGRTYVRPDKWRAPVPDQRLSEPAAELAARPASSRATGTRNGEQDT
jgi:hypothetical protein